MRSYVSCNPTFCCDCSGVQFETTRVAFGTDTVTINTMMLITMPISDTMKDSVRILGFVFFKTWTYLVSMSERFVLCGKLIFRECWTVGVDLRRDDVVQLKHSVYWIITQLGENAV